MDGQPILDVERPRSAGELIAATFELYGRLPLLFATLAAGVVVPYWLIVLAATGHGPLTTRGVSASVGLVLWVTQLSIEGPLISALHVHAVDDVAQGKTPMLRSVALRGLGTLPVVSAATVAAAIASYAGLILLIVPGVILWLGWTVVAQAAALEEGGWIDALKRSREVSRGQWIHIAATIFLAFLVIVIFSIPFSLVFRHTTTDFGSFVVGLLVQTLGTSFIALATALLFFDLRSRLRFADGRQVVNLGPDQPPPGSGGSDATGRPAVEPTGHPVDPASYTDGERPRGWFIDPTNPGSMRYWSGSGQYGWSPGTARTPNKTLSDWQAYKEANPDEAPAATSGGPAVEPTGHPLDPDSYSDEERPTGWYVVPEAPWKMRYWGGAGSGWSARTVKTPKGTLAGWYKVNDR